jgi:hypothetical protein
MSVAASNTWRTHSYLGANDRRSSCQAEGYFPFCSLLSWRCRYFRSFLRQWPKATTAKGNQGDSYEMSGAGTFDAQSKAVKAAGTFSHKSANGNVLETGVWLASELVSFDSYGVAPSALPHLGVASSPLAIGPKRMPMPGGPMPTGGIAVFRIVLLPMSGPYRTGVLQVNCAL